MEAISRCRKAGVTAGLLRFSAMMRGGSAVDNHPLFVAAALHPLSEQEGELQGLVGVEARVAMGVVAVLQVAGRDRTSTAGAFGDVLAGHLDMDAARMGAFRTMDLEEAFDFRQDPVE